MSDDRARFDSSAGPVGLAPRALSAPTDGSDSGAAASAPASDRPTEPVVARFVTHDDLASAVARMEAMVAELSRRMVELERRSSMPAGYADLRTRVGQHHTVLNEMMSEVGKVSGWIEAAAKTEKKLGTLSRHVGHLLGAEETTHAMLNRIRADVARVGDRYAKLKTYVANGFEAVRTSTVRMESVLEGRALGKPRLLLSVEADPASVLKMIEGGELPALQTGHPNAQNTGSDDT